MNSKQKRKERRKGLERKVDMTGVKSIEMMNDFCPYVYEKCGHPKQEYSFDCYGKYKMCQCYQKLNQ